jgi:hypothetical protein
MQVLDNEGHPDGKIDKHHAGNYAGFNKRMFN